MESEKGFISAPTAKELQLTEAEQQWFNDLHEWQKRSAKSKIILGKPMNPESQPFLPPWAF